MASSASTFGRARNRGARSVAPRGSLALVVLLSAGSALPALAQPPAHVVQPPAHEGAPRSSVPAQAAGDGTRHQETPPLANSVSGARRVGAFYHFGYRYPDEGLRDPAAPAGDPLSLHFPDPRGVSYMSAAWHASQVEGALDAGLDFLLAVVRPGPDVAPEKGPQRGLPFLVEALDDVTARRGCAPRLALYVETEGLAAGEADGLVDLAAAWGRELLYDTIRGFFRVIPPRHRACIDGGMLVVLGPSNVALRYRSNLFAWLRARFGDDFAGERLYLVCDSSWEIPADAAFEWGGPLVGPVIRDIALLGPGFDDSHAPEGSSPIRDREGGLFYEKSWLAVLAGTARVVLVQSWNGLRDGTAICETVEHDRKYIELTARYARWFRDGRRLSREIRLAHPAPRPRPDLFWGREQAGRFEVSWRPEFGFAARDGLVLGRWPDGAVRLLEVGGEPCAMTIGVTPGVPRYVYFLVSDSFLFDADERVIVDLYYHDSGGGTVTLEYDGAHAPAGAAGDGAYRRLETVLRGDEECWKRARFAIPDARFASRQNGRADFRFRVEGTNLIFREVVVRKTRGASPIGEGEEENER